MRLALRRPAALGPFLAALALAAGCSSPAAEAAAHSGRSLAPPGPRPAELATWQTLQRAEFARQPTPDTLEALRRGSPAVRARAAVALGRMPLEVPGEPASQALALALADETACVRALAAFGLGLRADATTAQAVLARLAGSESDPDVRARLVEAASRIATPEARAAVVAALADEHAAVRLEAALGPHRWGDAPGAAGAAGAPGNPADAIAGPSAAEVDAELSAALGRERVSELRWPLLFTLARRRAPSARGAFLEHADSPEVLERLFAVRGLARIEPEPRSAQALARAALDPDWRVVVEALLGLQESPGPEAAQTVLAALEHPSAHVRATALGVAPTLLEAWFAREAAGEDPGFALDPELFGVREANDPSLAVRAAALRARLRARFKPEPLAPASLAELGFEPGAEPWLAADAPPELRAANVAALGDFLPSALAVPAIAAHLDDDHPLVVGTALEKLGLHLGDASRALLRQFLQSADNGARLAAALALSQAPVAEDVTFFELSFLSARGDVAAELRTQLVLAAARTGTDRARGLLYLALSDEDPFVRRTAAAQLEQHFQVAPERREPTSAIDPALAPLLGRELDIDAENPRMVVSTERGDLVFELFPREAPWHVHNFLELARGGYYDGLTFHRVVPDFVVQGGDYRGDGNGGVTVTGVSQRHEITPRKHVRGSLGMPRNDNPDSGGSQIFVTHRPTPHLDGRYTIFGELREGFDVLDRIEIGDRILGARRLR